VPSSPQVFIFTNSIPIFKYPHYNCLVAAWRAIGLHNTIQWPRVIFVSILRFDRVGGGWRFPSQLLRSGQACNAKQSKASTRAAQAPVCDPLYVQPTHLSHHIIYQDTDRGRKGQIPKCHIHVQRILGVSHLWIGLRAWAYGSPVFTQGGSYLHIIILPSVTRIEALISLLIVVQYIHYIQYSSYIEDSVEMKSAALPGASRLAWPLHPRPGWEQTGEASSSKDRIVFSLWL